MIKHSLNIDLTKKPVQQKRQVFALEWNKVYYPKWLANMVMVKKSNGKWRMCVNFTNLNNACPKDSFPLPRID